MNASTMFITLCLSIFMSANTCALTLKIATAYPDGTEVVKTLRALNETLSQQTDNRVSLKIYPAGVMGSDAAVRRKIQIGQLDGSLAQSSAWADEFPVLRLYGLPFFFHSQQQVSQLRKQFDITILEAAENKQFKVLGLVDGGMAYAMTREPVDTLEKLQTQRLWLPNDAVLRFYARQFDLKTIDLNLSEIMTSLQTGSIDGLVVPPSVAITLQWHKSLNYLTDLPAVYAYGVMVIGQRALARVSAEDRSIIISEFHTALMHLDQTMMQQNSTAFAALAALNIRTLKPAEAVIKELDQRASQVWQQAVEQHLIPEQSFQQINEIVHSY